MRRSFLIVAMLALGLMTASCTRDPEARGGGAIDDARFCASSDLLREGVTVAQISTVDHDLVKYAPDRLRDAVTVLSARLKAAIAAGDPGGSAAVEAMFAEYEVDVASYEVSGYCASAGYGSGTR